MLPFSRLMRKTKAVCSPGKKSGETRDEYQMRYMHWWYSNHFDRTKMDLSELTATGLVTEETFEAELANSDEPLNPEHDVDWALKGMQEPSKVLISVERICSKEDGIYAVVDSVVEPKKELLVIDVDTLADIGQMNIDYEIHTSMPKKLGAGGCGTRINVVKEERKIDTKLTGLRCGEGPFTLDSGVSDGPVAE